MAFILTSSSLVGKVNHFYEDESHDWGYVQWVPKLAGVLWDGKLINPQKYN